nr:CIC_HP1_G0036520.mRNA.1.CDS.1 [Saccharomyces cerevisiae]
MVSREKWNESQPEYFEKMNVSQFLGISLCRNLNICSSMVLNISSAQRECFTHYVIMQGAVKRYVQLCVCWAGQKVSYRRIASGSTDVERMLRNDEEYKE